MGWRGIMQSTCQACGYRYTKNAAGATQCGRCGASRSEDEEKSRDEKPAQDWDLEATQALIGQLLREQKESAQRQQERQQQVLRNISDRQAEVWRDIMQRTCQACGCTKNAVTATHC